MRLQQSFELDDVYSNSKIILLRFHFQILNSFTPLSFDTVEDLVTYFCKMIKHS